jgi:hypothetical protein
VPSRERKATSSEGERSSEGEAEENDMINICKMMSRDSFPGIILTHQIY